MAGKTTKTKDEADRVADDQHASDMAEQQPKAYEARAFEPFAPRNYAVEPYLKMVMEWDDKQLDRLACLLSMDTMEMVAWSKVNAITADNHVLTMYHAQTQLIDGLNVFIKQLGHNLSTDFSPISIQSTTKEDLLAMKRNNGKARPKVDVSAYMKSGK